MDRRTFILLLVLIISVLVNTVVHFSHPAYRYYQTSIRDLEGRFSSFENSVRRDFVPAIISVATNRVFSSSVVSNVSNNSSLVPSSIDAQYFFACGLPYINLQGRVFGVGDDLYGFKIIDIRPTLVITDSRIFLLSSYVNRKQDFSSFQSPKTHIVP